MRLFGRKKTDEEAMSTPRETKRPWRTFFRVLAVIVVLLLGVRLIGGWWVGRDLTRAEQAVRDSGQPLRMSEITPPSVMAGDDAWPIYKSLLEKAEQAGYGQGDGDDEAERERLQKWLADLPARAEQAEEIGRIVDARPELLALLAQAAAKPAVGWRLTDDPLDPLEVNLLPILQLAELTMARAMIRFDAGRFGEALADVGTLAQLSDHLAQLPLPETRYLESQMLQLVRTLLAEMLGRIDATPAQLAALQGRLTGGTTSGRLVDSVLSFRAIRHTVYEKLAAYEISPDALAGGPKNVSWTTCLAIWSFRPFLDASHANSLRLLEELIPLLGQPYAELAEPLEKICDRVREESGGFTGATHRSAFECAAATLLAARSMAVAQATRRMAVLVLAVRGYQRDHDGELPETLAQLQPAYLEILPVDPMTGAAFGYLPKADPPRLYSVGLDRTDNGGATDAEEDPWGLRGHDMGFLLPQLPAATTRTTTGPAATRPATADSRPATRATTDPSATRAATADSRPATTPADSVD